MCTYIYIHTNMQTCHLGGILFSWFRANTAYFIAFQAFDNPKQNSKKPSKRARFAYGRSQKVGTWPSSSLKPNKKGRLAEIIRQPCSNLLESTVDCAKGPSSASRPVLPRGPSDLRARTSKGQAF